MQQLRDWLAGAHGIEAQQLIECIPAINGPKQPPKLANRRTPISRMGFAFFIGNDVITPCLSSCCDTCHNWQFWAAGAVPAHGIRATLADINNKDGTMEREDDLAGNAIALIQAGSILAGTRSRRLKAATA